MKLKTWDVRDYHRIERAINFIADHYLEQPSLAEVARAVNLSEFHLQRLFLRWAGISPKKFLQVLTLRHAKRILKQSRDVLSTSWDSGLSSAGRLHDLFITLEAMTPGEYKLGGQGLKISYGFGLSPFGLAFLAMTDRGVCKLTFVENNKRNVVLQEARSQWPKAKFTHNNLLAQKTLIKIFDRKPGPTTALKLLARGTSFQLRIWEALLKIPSGHLLSYQELAKLSGHPKAARAVGSAVAQNQIAYLIPCHRVIQAKGLVGDYRWGSIRKRAILGYEQARLVTTEI